MEYPYLVLAMQCNPPDVLKGCPRGVKPAQSCGANFKLLRLERVLCDTGRDSMLLEVTSALSIICQTPAAIVICIWHTAWNAFLISTGQS